MAGVMMQGGGGGGGGCVWKMLVVVMCCVMATTVVVGFNIDTKVPIVKRGPSNSYFGFSLAHHWIQGTEDDPDTYKLLVGAPKDNITSRDSDIDETVRRLNQPGAVYSCPLTSDRDDCELVKVFTYPPYGDQNRNDQWFGVTVDSPGSPTGQAMACAHRYKRTTKDTSKGLGICIPIDNNLEGQGEDIEPCKEKPIRSHNDYGLCQAGVGLKLGNSGEVLVGAPGSVNWRGALFKQSFAVEIGDSTKRVQSVADEPTAPATEPKPVVDLYAYLGYSAEIGNVISNKKTYVAGAPRSRDVGQVLLFVEDKDGLTVNPTHYLTGEQFGSSFGYSLAVLDLNKDGLDDVVVGAPFYLAPFVGGIIYVYMNGPQGITSDTKPIKIMSRSMKPEECRKLDCQNARFGFSLASAGDIDNDGYADLLVGAPYEGQGAIYLFRGSADGIIKEYAQRIAAEDLPASAQPLRTFGYSLSGRIDADGNSYPDVAVGAFAGSAALLLRSRPVIKMDLALQSTPAVIDAAKKPCKDNEPFVCFDLRICIAFTGQPADKFTSGLAITYKLEAEQYRKVSRVFFKGTAASNEIEKNITLNRPGSPYNCQNHMAYVRDQNTDFLNPIVIKASVRLAPKDPPRMTTGGPLPDLNTYPVVNELTASKQVLVDWVKNCGVDQQCQSRMTLHLEPNVSRNADGEFEMHMDVTQDLFLYVRVVVNNTGEDAHEPSMTLVMPTHISYSEVEGASVSCTPEKSLVVCYLANPLMHGHASTYTMRFKMESPDKSSTLLHFSAHLNTTSIMASGSNHFAEFDVRQVVSADVIVFGSSDVTEVFYGGKKIGESAVQHEEDIGPQVIHIYEVKNQGRSTMHNVMLTIGWPYELELHYPKGEHLLYLLDTPHADRSDLVTCTSPPGIVNPLGDKLQKFVYTPRTAQSTSEEIASASLTDGKTADSDKSLRHKRQSDDDPAAVLGRSERPTKVEVLDCDNGRAKCAAFDCTINRLGPDDSIVIRMRSRLWNATFIEHFMKVDHVNIYSKATLRLDATYNFKQASPSGSMAKAKTRAVPVREKEEVPVRDYLWLIILAIVIGIIILVVIIIILWRLGFFKRKSPAYMHKGEVHKKNKKKKKTSRKQDMMVVDGSEDF